jgi:hypothetical protein
LVVSCAFQLGISAFVTDPILKIKLAVVLAQVFQKQNLKSKELFRRFWERRQNQLPVNKS